ncbi:MAG TPA: hypothetical protein VKG44_04775 [Candidatus Baltobacteraceae bacterium]|nr:hypothetical protein [Candidatus Baltobacteraceae bacterium]
MKRALALIATVAFLAQPAVAQTPAPQQTPAPLYVRGQFLALSHSYIILTTGDALALDPATTLPAGLKLGVPLRLTLDPLSHAVRAIEVDPRAEPGDIDASKLPREYVVADPKSSRSDASSTSSAASPLTSVTITINVRVPGSTPQADDIYVATDRSNFSPAEIRMVRIDTSRWTAQLVLPAGTVLRYDFSRGSFSNLERTRDGSIVTPRSLNTVNGAKTDDSVAAWADTN